MCYCFEYILLNYNSVIVLNFSDIIRNILMAAMYAIDNYKIWTIKE